MRKSNQSDGDTTLVTEAEVVVASSDVGLESNDGEVPSVNPSVRSCRRSFSGSRVTVERKDADSKDEETQTVGHFLILEPAAIPPPRHSIIGNVLALLSAMFLSFGSFLVKVLISKGIPAENCVIWRGAVPLVVTSIWLIQIFACTDTKELKEALWPPTLKGRIKVQTILIFSRVIVGPVSVLAQSFSLKYIPLGDSNTVIYSAAVFVPIFAYCLLHEAWGVVPFIASILTAIGVTIISKPAFLTGKETDDGDGRLVGFMFAVGTLACNVTMYIALRYMLKISGILLIWLMSAGSVLLGLLLSLSMGHGILLPPDYQILCSILGVATFTCAGQFCLVYACRYEEASTVSLVRSSEIVFGFLWQMILQVFPDEFSLGGAFLVLFSFGLAFFRKYVQHLPADNKWKRRLRCFLM